MGAVNLNMKMNHGDLTNAQKKNGVQVLKSKKQDYTNGKWVKVEGAPGNLTVFKKNQK